MGEVDAQARGGCINKDASQRGVLYRKLINVQDTQRFDVRFAVFPLTLDAFAGGANRSRPGLHMLNKACIRSSTS